MSAIESLRTTCWTLARPEAEAEALAARLGEVVPPPEPSALIEVRPRDPAFRRARVVRLPGSREPSHVELELTEPLALATLVEAFGPATALPRLHPDSPVTHQLAVPPKDRARPCVLLAELPVRPPDDPAAGLVERITLRRD